jgi:hypothetical protein
MITMAVWLVTSFPAPGLLRCRTTRLRLNLVDALSDPDLQHLADLLGFLPGPDDGRFWTLVDERGTQRTRRYVLDKMSWHLLTLRTADPPPHKVVALVEYLMMFFGGGNPALNELLVLQ